RQITLDTSAADVAGKSHLKLRRWDQTGASGTADGIAMTADWLDLEDGIQVQFAEGTYRAGDYWLIPARTATAEIEWPPYAVPNTPPRRHITVRSGYAIDCEGNDIIHEDDEPLDLLQMIADYNTLHPNEPLLTGDGEVCLVLTGDAEQPYALEKYDPAWNSWQTLFKGTLLSDFLNDCLGPLTKFWHDETTPAPDEGKLPVGPT